ncbi:TetR/AcrR family transcriptional regulator [Antrihabitans stalactiti]|uniref:TetR/AcrR family transcriptional regulator n=1 Tax=Antrihabitans stalactiti TaxID=2584121 RepID=A0A848KKH2_9NOCA|nr:TetR/AcrR family transcriptional regulator [Antrihabitans stalactiti]NMN98368.1 TetR/AcrR family transcriptional regulator [Antrihabitans stalactiti]
MTETREVAATSRAEATRARLMVAAIAAFAEKGFHGTTTRDIAAAAGMSPAALYVHHRSKEELLYMISRAGHERTLTLVRNAIAVGGTPAEKLRRVVHDFAVHHAERHTESRIVNYELAALSPVHLVEIRKIRREIDAEVRELVESGVASGDFETPHARVSSVALLSLGIDLARWYREEGAWKPKDIADRYADMALRIVGAQHL